MINAGSLVSSHGSGFLEIDFEKREVLFYIFQNDSETIVLEKTEKF